MSSKNKTREKYIVLPMLKIIGNVFLWKDVVVPFWEIILALAIRDL